MAGSMTFIKDKADQYPYDNTSTGFTADNVQDAVDELDAAVQPLNVLKKLHFLRYSRSSTSTGSTPSNPGDGHLYAGISGKSSTNSPLRSGNGNFDLDSTDSLSPLLVPFTGTIVKATASISQSGVTAAAPSYPVLAKYDLEDITFSGRNKLQTIDFPIDNTHPVGIYWSLANTNYKEEIALSIPVTEGQMLALLFNSSTSSASQLVTCSMVFITLTIEES